MKMISSLKESNTRDGKTTFTVRESYDDDTSKTITVREAENGFIVRMERSYYEGKEGEKKYKYEEKEYISKTNPLEEKKVEKKEEKDDTKEITSSIASFVASMTNKLIV